MPIVTRKEFAELCLDDEKKLNVYISRRKVSPIAGNKKLIDTDDPVNAAFISDRITANSVKISGIKPVKAEKPVKVKAEKPVKEPKKAKVVAEKPVVKSQSKPIKEPKIVVKPPKEAKVPIVKVQSQPKVAAIPKSIRVMQEAQTLVNHKRVELDTQLKVKQLQNAELQIELKQLALNKAAGKLLDVDLVKGVLTRHANSIFKSFEKGCENIASIFAGSDQQLFVGIMKDLKPELSRCVKDAGVKADEELDILVTEFSETLARGQRKL